MRTTTQSALPGKFAGDGQKVPIHRRFSALGGLQRRPILGLFPTFRGKSLKAHFASAPSSGTTQTTEGATTESLWYSWMYASQHGTVVVAISTISSVRPFMIAEVVQSRSSNDPPNGGPRRSSKGDAEEQRVNRRAAPLSGEGHGLRPWAAPGSIASRAVR
jgi:hypothetical protein